MSEPLGNRHLIDLRPAEFLPKAQRIEEILVMAPEELIARKVISYQARRGQPKSGTDWRDLALLMLAFPELKTETGAVRDSLEQLGTTTEVFNTWRELVALELSLPNEEDEFM